MQATLAGLTEMTPPQSAVTFALDSTPIAACIVGTTELSHMNELITAITNDLAYDDVFVYQLRMLAEPGDVLMTISSSGDSENVVRAIDWARGHKA